MARQAVGKNGDFARRLRGFVRRVVRLARPQKVILFGSRAAGRARPGSDVDLRLIVRRPPAAGIEDAIYGLERGFPLDLTRERVRQAEQDFIIARRPPRAAGQGLHDVVCFHVQ